MDSPGARSEHALNAAQSLRASAQERARIAEERSARQLQLSLVLLGVLAAQIGFVGRSLRTSEASAWWWVAVVIFAGATAACLTSSALLSLVTDRVGMELPIYPGPVAEERCDGTQRRKLAELETNSSLIANWTATHKHNEVLRAAGHISRGLLMLLFTTLLSLAVWWNAPSNPDSEAHAEAHSAAALEGDLESTPCGCGR